jgi:hypothetical protein
MTLARFGENEMTGEEKAIRKRLGIPDAAERVIVFGESSHWDPNWLLTSKQYYALRTRYTMSRAVHELEKEPRRVYSVECVFFVKMYWDRHPEKHDAIRRLVNEGRMRFTGSGVTTPDTILPATEAIIRDYLIGQEWLRNNGMDQEPRLAYLPDDFGHSPTVPDLLCALGYDMAAVSRIDGGYFPGCDYRLKSAYPLPGSSAELLKRDLMTADFVWRGPAGGKVLTHWNAFTYFQGDMIAHHGPIKWMGYAIGIPARSAKAVARKIDSYVKQLEPLSRTPYMFCPIGCDFVDPIPGLVGLLDGYNEYGYPRTGVWAVNAGMDDYLDLVACHGDQLPEIELDPNPLWTGFYSARPEMKQRCKKLSHDLVLAEKLLAVAGREDDPGLDVKEELERAWYTLAVSNHHDFITGTSPDRVWEREQKPWLIKAQERADAAIEKALGACPDPPAAKEADPPSWSLSHGRLLVETRYYVIELDEGSGGCITRWIDPESGDRLLAGPGNDSLLYKDTGGLWRMGHEYRGGEFRELGRESRNEASVRVIERDGVLEAVVESEPPGGRLVRRLWFRSDSPVVRMSLTGSCAKRRAVTCRFSTSFRPLGLVMDVPAGVVERLLVKIYNPTFWAATSFVHLRDRESGRGMAAFFGGPACVSADSNGTIEWIALRNAPKETAFGFLPLLSHPAKGVDSEVHTLDYAVFMTTSGGWRDNLLGLTAQKVLSSAWIKPGAPDVEAMADSTIHVEGGNVMIGCAKKASRGQGLIIRLISFNPGPHEIGLKVKNKAISRAFICDARERDLKEAEVENGEGRIMISGPITTVRLHF